MNATGHVLLAEQLGVKGFTFRFLTPMKGLFYFIETFIVSQLSYLYNNGMCG